MNRFIYTAGKPVKIGDTVHVRNRAYFVAALVGDHVGLYSMDDIREYRHVFPQDIGATIVDSATEPQSNSHVHPTVRRALKCF